MTGQGRRTATPSQPRSSEPGFRSRERSGSRSRGRSTLRLTQQLDLERHLAGLTDLIAGVGPPCIASGPTAAALHGFDGYEFAPPLHLLVPRGRNIARVGHVVHTSTRIDRIDVTTVLGVATTNATRTIVDLARIETSERLTTAIDSATRDRLTTDDVLLHRALALRTRGRGGIAALVDALNGIEITRGGHSWLEREFLRRCAAAGLPRPRTQQVLGRRGRSMIRVDCRFPDTPVVVELLGYAFHRTVIQMQNDAERMNRLTLDGHTVLQFTFTDVTERPDEVVALVTEALARHQ